jgi:hypothetical protein
MKELQSWTSVSSLMRKHQPAPLPMATDSVHRPRVAVVLSPPAAGTPRDASSGAVEMDPATGALRVPSGPKGGFRFDSVTQPSEGGRMFEQQVAPLVDDFVNTQRSGAVVLVGREAACVREVLGGSDGGSDAAGADGLLSKLLMRLVPEPTGTSGPTWDLVVTVSLPEATGMMVGNSGSAAASTPAGSPRASPRMRPVAVRLEKTRDVTTACSVISRQLAQIWGGAAAAVGGHLICSIRRRSVAGGRRGDASPRSAGPVVAYKQSASASDGGSQLSIVVFGAVEPPNHVTFRTLTRLLKLRQNKEQPPKSKEAEERAYALAANTVHVRGIPMDFSEAALQERFGEFGYVLTAVIRIRKPDAEHAHNSWALVAFADEDSVERLMGTQTVAQVEGDAMTFTARRINPKLAMSSDGSFGQIFQTCKDRVAQARAIALACADSKVTYHLRDRYGRHNI